MANGEESSNGSSLKRQLSNEDEQDDITTLKEFIDGEKEMENLVGALLGASDDTNCSYGDGYVYRQALYGCATCFNEMKKNKQVKENDENEQDDYLHGICLACSMNCHADHDLYELYTKRKFRCDCGNNKFKLNDGNLVNQCKLKPDKEPLNELNKYNHNFKGLYCICDKPYPDNGSSFVMATENNRADELATKKADNEEENVEVGMFQCVACEDWFHETHLSGFSLFPESVNDTQNDEGEIICQQCMNQLKFLWYYNQTSLPQTVSKPSTSSEVNQQSTSSSSINVDDSITTTNINNDNVEGSSVDCLLERIKSLNSQSMPDSLNAAYFVKDWREQLCKCDACLNMYKEKQVEYLLDTNDILSYYEEKGKKNIEATEDKLLKDHLDKMNRVSQVEFLLNMNDFKQELGEFFLQFLRSGEAVKRDDVMKFFENLNERKKRKLEDSNQFKYNYFCK